MSKKEEINSTWKQMAEKKAEKIEEPEVKVSFQKLSSAEPVKYLKIGVHGQQKSGKTRFALTATPPIYVIVTEPGLRPLIKLFPNKEIYFVDVYKPDYAGVFEVEANKTLAKIDAAVKSIRKMVLDNPESVGTVVVDSVTDIWKWVQEWMKVEILKIDKTARVKQQWDWGYANNKYQNIIMQLLSLPTHLILTAQDREEYAGAGMPSGTYEPRWMGQTPYWVDIIIGMIKIKDKAGVVHYMSEIEDSRHMDESLNPIAGRTIENLTFDKVVEVLTKKEK